MSVIPGAAATGVQVRIALTATTVRAITAGIIVRNSSATIITGRAITADIARVDIKADIKVDTAAEVSEGASAPSSLYSAAITAFATSAVPLLPPNSNGLMPSA